MVMLRRVFFALRERVGSGHGIIGDQVPRKEDGTFDAASASLYWRFFWMVDGCFGTDFCGCRDVEFDD